MKKKLFATLFILVCSVFFVTFLSGKEVNAAVDFNANITTDAGSVINNSVIDLQDNDYYNTNGSINNSVVIGKNISVTLSGKTIGLPKTIKYVSYELGYAIPFQATLFLTSVHGTGYNTSGIYTGTALSFKL